MPNCVEMVMCVHYAGDQFWQTIEFTLTTLYRYTREEQTTHLIYRLFMIFVTLPKDSTEYCHLPLGVYCSIRHDCIFE